MTSRRQVIFALPGRRRRMILSLAPLIDVTFILLIFFMLVTQFQRYAPVDVTLGAEQSIPLSDLRQETGPPDALILDIRADGSIRLDGRDATSIDDLGGVLAEAAGNGRVADADTLIVAIKPEANVPLQLLIDVLSAVQKNPSLKSRIIIPESMEGDAE